MPLSMEMIHKQSTSHNFRSAILFTSNFPPNNIPPREVSLLKGWHEARVVLQREGLVVLRNLLPQKLLESARLRRDDPVEIGGIFLT